MKNLFAIVSAIISVSAFAQGSDDIQLKIENDCLVRLVGRIGAGDFDISNVKLNTLYSAYGAQKPVPSSVSPATSGNYAYKDAALLESADANIVSVLVTPRPDATVITINYRTSIAGTSSAPSDGLAPDEAAKATHVLYNTNQVVHTYGGVILKSCY